jgi:DNA-binding GntR family transcriptional regulator
VAIQNAFIRHALCPSIVYQGLSALYLALEEGYGLRLGRALQTVAVKPADDYGARLLEKELQLPGRPLSARA